MAGFDLVSATDGESALALLERSPDGFDLLLAFVHLRFTVAQHRIRFLELLFLVGEVVEFAIERVLTLGQSLLLITDLRAGRLGFLLELSLPLENPLVGLQLRFLGGGLRIGLRALDDDRSLLLRSGDGAPREEAEEQDPEPNADSSPA